MLLLNGFYKDLISVHNVVCGKGETALLYAVIGIF